MTREQRCKHYYLPEHVSQMDKIEKIILEVIEDCHDDFESRTCENCKHSELEDLGIYCPFVNYCGSDYMDKNFGCLKFGRKQNEN